jgi:hypothetical protein
VALAAATALVAAEEVVPLPRAHAHNDYHHRRPLHDALDNGFCSVEADVFLEKGELRVGHFHWLLRKGRTLESLYLEPLAKRVRANGGSVYPQKTRFILLVDIKQDGDAVYPVLDKLLERYRDILTGHEDGRFTERAVTVVLSGGSPRRLVEEDATRYCAIDGRPPDLGTDTPATLVPLVSDSWKGHFQWRGRGEFPAEERERLADFAARAHRDGRLLRFWGAPDREEAWSALHEAGVDLINTDRLADLSTFLRGLDAE